MRYFGVNLLDAATMTNIGTNGIKLSVLKVMVHGCRPVSLLDFVFSFRKRAWFLNLMLLGLWVVSSLEQPGWQQGDEIQIAQRKWSWGFNYFQKVRMNEDA